MCIGGVSLSGNWHSHSFYESKLSTSAFYQPCLAVRLHFHTSEHCRILDPIFSWLARSAGQICIAKRTDGQRDARGSVFTLLLRLCILFERQRLRSIRGWSDGKHGLWRCKTFDSATRFTSPTMKIYHTFDIRLHFFISSGACSALHSQ